MLFVAPELSAHDLAVIGAIEDYRRQLRYFLREPRRWTGQLRRNLRARAMRGSNSIEGYDVSLDDAIALLEEEETLDADERTVAEVRGYRNAMTYVQQLAADPNFHFDPSLVRSLHFMMLGHDLSKSPGSYRLGEIFVRDEDANAVVYTGPDADLVPALMDELLHELEHLDDNIGESPIFVTAAMAHLNLVMIHPFRDGNGRMARCLQTMILARNQILAPEFSSIEEWLGRNTSAYYNVLADVGQGSWNPGHDAQSWVRFNLAAHYMQAQTVLQRVKETERLWSDLLYLAEKTGLPERVVEALYSASVGLRVRRPAYESDAQIEGATAQRDLKAMVDKGLLVARGQTRGRYYLGSEELRAIYTRIRREQPRHLHNPYDVEISDLGPEAAARRRVTTVT
jgi:Fic family protein